MGTERNNLHPLTDNENHNSILFEDDSDIYDVTSDDFLENWVPTTANQRPCILENFEITSLDLLSGGYLAHQSKINGTKLRMDHYCLLGRILILITSVHMSYLSRATTLFMTHPLITA